MPFPHNPNDDSLDFEGFEALNKTQQAAILTELRTENPIEFRQVMDFYRARQAQTTQNLTNLKTAQQALDKRHAELEVEKNTYLAAYKVDMANGSSAQHKTLESNNKKKSQCSVS